jgi:hypothetical protein
LGGPRKTAELPTKRLIFVQHHTTARRLVVAQSNLPACRPLYPGGP